jgi:pyruvate,orthophosphate dikinase
MPPVRSGAGLVARQLGLPCIVGCGDMVVEPEADRAHLGSTIIAGGDWVTIEGDSGRVHLGRGEIATSRPEVELAEVARWHTEDHTPPAAALRHSG